MLLPAASAAPAPPFAVLLLAWDEAAPAVRAMLEAGPAGADTLVIAPAAPASQLPATTPAAPAPVAEASPASVAEDSPGNATEASPASVANSKPIPAAPTTSPPVPAAALVLPVAPGGVLAAAPVEAAQPAEPLAPSPNQLPAPAARGRIVHLSSFSLPELAAQAGRPLPAPVWAGPIAAPAAPYQGAAPTAQAQAVNYPATAPAPEATAPDQRAVAPPVAKGAALPAARPATLPVPAAAGLVLASAPTPAAGTAARVVPGQLAASPFFSSPTDEPDAPLDPDFPTLGPAMPTLAAEAEAPEPAAAESDAWPVALAALQTPTAVPAAAASHAVLVPPTFQPSAPDLNFQLIQYARFAVPLALANQPFSVLYAPTWPTWLAAQELRQRTGIPLVLHVEILAAGTGSADTAIGWVAELQRQALRRADLVLAETHALASRLRRELGLPAHAVRVVPAADTAAVARALHRARVYEASALVEATE